MKIRLSGSLSAAIVYQISRHLTRYYPSSASLPMVLIDPSQQQLYVVERFLACAMYPISSSRYGLGCQDNSWKTPIGMHRIKEKIGAGEPLYSEFIARRPSGTQLPPDRAFIHRQNDAICTRILRLEGLEPMINQGRYCDSYDRYIYIHGTTDERGIGKPTSVGCIRMKNDDVIQLFDNLEVGSLVYILNLDS